MSSAQPLDVLLLGGGGREHALAWKIRRSPLVGSLHAAPGNPGIAAEASCADLDISDPAAVGAWAGRHRIGLVVVGPEAPLVAGVADELERLGVAVFGPTRAAARIEGSKVFAKEFMKRHGIPTAGFRVFDDAAEADRFLASAQAGYPAVVKADGLAAGKGVAICPGPAEARAAAARALSQRAFGEAGARIVVEEMLEGREVSFFALADGRRAVPLATSRDYKRLGDGDEGPNTGGMGAFSPADALGAEGREEVMRRIVEPTLAGLAAEGHPFRGLLYVGLMLTGSGPQVLEYNARFGDPETQALLPRLDSDLVPLLHAAARGDLGGAAPVWSRQACVCVVLASGGYPGAHRTGLPIEGLDEAGSDPRVTVFHAGTRRSAGGGIETSGGRVLGVTALGETLEAARRLAYDAAGRIRFEDRQYRTDIARR